MCTMQVKQSDQECEHDRPSSRTQDIPRRGRFLVIAGSKPNIHGAVGQVPGIELGEVA